MLLPAVADEHGEFSRVQPALLAQAAHAENFRLLRAGILEFDHQRNLAVVVVETNPLQPFVRDALVRTRTRYVAFAIYLILINSLVEEMVWRWFVLQQCERLMSRRIAVLASAAFFTLHHALVFHVQFGSSAGALASASVFAAGCIWSWCYSRVRSIWPGYVSHVAVDLAGLAIGWRVLFG